MTVRAFVSPYNSTPTAPLRPAGCVPRLRVPDGNPCPVPLCGLLDRRVLGSFAMCRSGTVGAHAQPPARPVTAPSQPRSRGSHHLCRPYLRHVQDGRQRVRAVPAGAVAAVCDALINTMFECDPNPLHGPSTTAHIPLGDASHRPPQAPPVHIFNLSTSRQVQCEVQRVAGGMCMWRLIE